MAIKVLIVDDNELYRTAFRRSLMIKDYDVVEAENGSHAVEVYEKENPDIVVTDLSMRTPTEGLDLIKSIKAIDPLIPIVMISAVGTFEEGSLAKELGADRVLMKQKIDEHIEELFDAIDGAKKVSTRLRALREEIGKMANDSEELGKEAVERLRNIISTPNQHPVILAEAYDVLAVANAREIRVQMEREYQKAGSGNSASMEEVETHLKSIFDDLKKFDPETVKELCVAEYFYRVQGGDIPEGEDFSRNIGFSYCFAVENEAKTRLRKRLQRFLSDHSNFKIIRKLIDDRTNQLDLFYHQYLLRLQQQMPFDFTIDNVRQVFQRVLEHESRYKPDGLKALGIMIVCFGRDYSLKALKGQIKVNNPLGIKAFDDDMEVLKFAHLLVSLQHYRNPYIHPEISEMEKISKIRETTVDCLKMISRLN
ncbi:MAG: response regulator [Candidatus Sumerlaeia bacterium]|nr:response regulator [Candidatus Sumerlaeia bacterium]